MKREKNVYWTTTIIATAMTVTPAFFYFTNAFFITAIHRLGFPDYFRYELAVGKIIGAFLMLVPSIPKMFKEWTYVAFGITLLSGSLAHGVLDGFAKGILPLIPFAFLCVSYYYFRKLNYEK